MTATSAEQLRDTLLEMIDADMAVVVVGEATSGGRTPRRAIAIYDARVLPCGACGKPANAFLPVSIRNGQIEPWPRDHTCGTLLPSRFVARFTDEVAIAELSRMVDELRDQIMSSTAGPPRGSVGPG